MPQSEPVPPIAAVRPHLVESPHGTRVDEYYWLRDDTRTNPDVLGYLEAENAYKQAMMKHTDALEERPLDEPINEAFRATTLTLGWDVDAGQILIEARAPSEDDEEE